MSLANGSKRKKFPRAKFAVEVLEDRTLPSASPLDGLAVPLGFEENVGQTDSQVQFLARGQGYGLFLTPGEAVLNLYHARNNDDPGTVLRATIVGADLSARVEGVDLQDAKANYYLGNDPAQWREGVNLYSRVQYHDIYPGIDLVYYGTSAGQLEYDFIVSPGADPSVIKVSYAGADSIDLDAEGNLVLHTPGGDVVQHAPIIYQDSGTVRVPIAGSFVLGSSSSEERLGTSVGFQLGAYDPSLPLVIDPVLVYSTYHGGSGADEALDLFVDNNGTSYVTGFTRSSNFPLSSAYDSTLGGSSDAFVSQFSATGTLVFSTYLGGSGRENDSATLGGFGAVYFTNRIYVTGFTQSANFPIVGGMQSTLRGTQDAFVAQLRATGTLNISTYLGGTGDEAGTGIRVSGGIYLTGWTSSTDFPLQSALYGSSGGGVDGFVAQLNSTGSALVFSTYLGGSGDDFATDLDFAGGNVYVTGRTLSNNFPTTAGMDSTLGGSSDAFVAKLNSAGSSLLFSTYLGGSGDENLDPASSLNIGSLTVDTANSVYVTGSTASGDFPILGPFDTSLGGAWDAFVTKFDSAGSMTYSSFLGGSGNDVGLAVYDDRAFRTIITGYTESADFPTAFPIQAALAGSRDAFVSVLDPAGINLTYSSFLGGPGVNIGRGIGVDDNDRVYVAGMTDSSSFPTQTPRQASAGGAGDAFVARMGVIPGATVAGQGGNNWSYVPGGFVFCSTIESGTTDTYNIVLNAGPAANVLVTVNPDAQSTVSPTVLTFTPANWSTRQTVTITAFDDALVEGGHNGLITHTLTSADTSFDGLTIPAVSVNITDNDTIGVIHRRGVSVNETGPTSDNGDSVRLNSTPTADVFVTFNPGTQVTITPSVLTFTPANWFTYQQITVTAVDDLLVEGTPHDGIISHTLTSSDPGYNGLVVADVTASITDNDTPAITVDDDAGGFYRNFNVTEGGWTDIYRMRLLSVPSADVVIALSPDSQITVAPSALTFTATNWNVWQTVTVTAVDDAVVESVYPAQHSGVITHAATSADTNYNGLPVAGVTADIFDNDTPGVFKTGGLGVSETGPTTQNYDINLLSIPTANVVLTLTPDSQVSVVPSTLTFTPANWYIQRSVAVTPFDDGIDEPSPHSGVITYAATSADSAYNGIAISNTTASITDDDTASVFLLETFGSTDVTEGGTTDTYTVRLLSQPIADVAVSFNPGTQLSVSAAVITFNAGNWNLPFTVTVTAVDDFVDEISPGTGTITHTATSADPLYNGIAFPTVTAAVTDNDIAGVNLTPSGGSTLLAEGGGSDTHTVVLNSQPTANVVVTLSPDAQVSVSPGAVLTFTALNWNLPQTVTVTAIDDFMVETSPHAGVVSHTAASADPFYSGLLPSALTANITDNDVGGVAVTQSGGSTDVTEGLGSDTYTVVLASLPAANVIITLGAGTQVTLSTPRLTFTPANWDTQQTVIVSAVDDAIFEGAHTAVITHTPSSADLVYNSIPIGSVTANITDNDAVGIVQSGGSTGVVEGGATDTCTVVLASQPTANVIITFAPGSQLTVTPAPITFTSLNWNVPQTVTIGAADDMIAEGTHSGVVSQISSSSDPFYNGVVIVNVTASITDNDIAGVTVTPTGGSTFVSEGIGSDIYSVVLNTQPTANVLITMSPDPDLVVLPSVLTFSPASWNVPQPVTVGAPDDGIQQGLRTRYITHLATSSDLFYQGVGVAGMTVSINDPPGVSLTPAGGQNAILEGVAVSYTAILNTQPSANVTIDLASDGQVLVSPAQLVFTPTDWNTPRPVIITAVDDSVVEGPHQGLVDLTVTSLDPAYNGFGSSTFTAAIVDNDGDPIVGTSKADQIVISTSADRTRIQVSINNKVTSFPSTLAQLVLQAGDGNDNIQIYDPALPLVIIGGQGTDKVFVTGAAGANSFVLDSANVRVGGINVELWQSESLVVGGRTSSDVFSVQNIPAFATEFKGDAGNDQVFAGNRPNTWQITSPNGGTLNRTLKLTGIENWTGGSLADRFVVGSGKSISGQIDGGGGSDVLDYAAWTGAVTVNLQTQTATSTQAVRNIARYIGGKGGADKLIAADANNLWNITSPNAGSVNGVSFQGFDHLTGGLLDDTFRLADNQGVKGKIDGGAGNDTLDYSSYRAKGVIVNLQAKSATNTAGFLNLEAFLAGSNPQDLLTGANLANTWQITGAGAGTVNGIAFANFKNLTGGSNIDTFAPLFAGDWQGTLNGGAGKDSLVANPANLNLWVNSSLTAGTLNGRKFTAIEVRH